MARKSKEQALADTIIYGILEDDITELNTKDAIWYIAANMIDDVTKLRNIKKLLNMGDVSSEVYD